MAALSILTSRSDASVTTFRSGRCKWFRPTTMHWKFGMSPFMTQKQMRRACRLTCARRFIQVSTCAPSPSKRSRARLRASLRISCRLCHAIEPRRSDRRLKEMARHLGGPLVKCDPLRSVAKFIADTDADFLHGRKIEIARPWGRSGWNQAGRNGKVAETLIEIFNPPDPVWIEHILHASTRDPTRQSLGVRPCDRHCGCGRSDAQRISFTPLDMGECNATCSIDQPRTIHVSKAATNCRLPSQL